MAQMPKTMPRGRHPVAAAILLALAGALVPAGPAAAQWQNPFPRLDPDAPVGTGEVTECAMGGMTDGLRCGVLRVWEDREAASGRTLDIHFAIVDATEQAARTDDPIFFFFGGPGAPAIGAAPGIARGFAPFHRTRDLVLVDLRGIGLSGALNCDVPYPGGFASRFGAIFATDHIAACRDTLSRRADLTRYTTPISVDDLEAIRRFMGYGPVNIFGGSYGTRVAQVWMRRYPESVRTVIMNGVTAVSEPGYVNTSPNLQQALDQVMAQCEADTACAEAYPDLPGMVEEAFGRFDNGPVPVELGDGRTVQFHGADLGYALRGLLYSRSDEVPYRIWQAAHGELTELADYYVQRTDWVASNGDTSAGNHFSVICAEDIDPVTDEMVARAAEGTFLQGHVIQAYRSACDVWPAAELPAGFFQPVQSDIPTLLLSGGRDPVTPHQGAELVARGLTHHVHVIVPGAGHGVLDQCAARMMMQLIEDGSVDHIDTSCVSAVPEPEFRLP